MSLPFTKQESVWSSKATTETVTLDTEFSLCMTKIIEVITTGFSGTLDIKGKQADAATYDNVLYSLMGQVAQVPSVAQLSYTTDTNRYRYVVPEYWHRMQLVMTRTAGSITVDVVGIDISLPILPSQDTSGNQYVAIKSGADLAAIQALNATVEQTVKALLVRADLNLRRGSQAVPVTMIALDSDAAWNTAGFTLPVSAMQWALGSDIERVRNNITAELLASGARTATVSSTDQTNHNARGVMVTLDVTALADTPSVVLTIEAKMGDKYEVLLTSAAVTATGVHTFIVYPGCGAAANDVTVVNAYPLPRTWKVKVTHGEGSSITYDVQASLIL